jgi:penicillin-binding protein 2
MNKFAFRSLCVLVLVTFMISACTPDSTVTPTLILPTNTLPQPQISTTRPPDVEQAVKLFLETWKNEDYAAMHEQLTSLSRDALSVGDFVNFYRETAINLTLINFDYEVLSVLTNPSQAQAGYAVTFHTTLAGDLRREMLVNLSMENGTWKVQWNYDLILPELKGGNRLTLDVTQPSRGNIYDREGNALAAQAEIVALGIWPGRIEREGKMLQVLSELTGKTAQSIKPLYQNAGADWYIPVGQALAAEVDERMDDIISAGGIIMNRYTSRFYYEGGLAPHVTGYVQTIPESELSDYRRRGYRGDERVGVSGLEKWGEDYLSGKRGGSIYVVDPQGAVVTRLVQADSLPSQAIYTTLSADLQLQAQRAINGFNGAVVVVERDTGRILAMATSPSFDPNLFEPPNENSGWLLPELLNSTEQPFLNRATQGLYPPGSIFKVVTMAAALESMLYTPETKYMCKHDFTELLDVTLYDWTYEKKVSASGELSLVEGLMRSCDPYFYHIGLDLFRQNRPQDVANMARAFGLGSAASTGQIAEEIGSIPDPQNEREAVQMAFGQGASLVTPLQTAMYIAAIGNGGTLYEAQVVEKIVPPTGDPTMVFSSIVKSMLPVSPLNLAAIQEGMREVVRNTRGTAHRPLLGLGVPVYGKTGTATTSILNANHAWFAGYTNAQRTDLPDIAVVVIAEYAGEGSQIAAPIFRRVVEGYFFGRPLTVYPWETTIYITRTPTSQYTRTAPPPEVTPIP